tara:strand:+ start:416 stop:763 length:348 start_codon:yes stop_codon:yes gene_type:complete
MKHYSKINKALEEGDTVDYPKSGNRTSVLQVTKKEEKDDGDIAYLLQNKDKTFGIEIYHSKLENVVGAPKVETKLDREALKAEANEMGIEYPKNIKAPRLQALIEAHKNGAVPED